MDGQIDDTRIDPFTGGPGGEQEAECVSPRLTWRHWDCFQQGSSKRCSREDSVLGTVPLWFPEGRPGSLETRHPLREPLCSRPAGAPQAAAVVQVATLPPSFSWHGAGRTSSRSYTPRRKLGARLPAKMVMHMHRLLITWQVYKLDVKLMQFHMQFNSAWIN